MTRVTKIAFPPESGLFEALPGPTFKDAFETELRDADLTPMDIAQRATGATPGWVDLLMGLRDRIVAPLGLKTSRQLTTANPRQAASYKVNDRIGIFRIFSVNETEVVLGINDKHLDVRLSFLKRRANGRPSYAVCSVVRTHNLLGRLYMIPVGRVHPFVVRGMMRQARV